jgi:hypothetical protein
MRFALSCPVMPPGLPHSSCAPPCWPAAAAASVLGACCNKLYKFRCLWLQVFATVRRHAPKAFALRFTDCVPAFLRQALGPSPQRAMARGGAAPTEVYGSDIRHFVFWGLECGVPCEFNCASITSFLLVLLSRFHCMTKLLI